jgi:hypothetical protein
VSFAVGAAKLPKDERRHSVQCCTRHIESCTMVISLALQLRCLYRWMCGQSFELVGDASAARSCKRTQCLVSNDCKGFREQIFQLGVGHNSNIGHLAPLVSSVPKTLALLIHFQLPSISIPTSKSIVHIIMTTITFHDAPLLQELGSIYSRKTFVG